MYERKKIAAVFVFTLCLAVTLALAFGSFLSKAKAREKETVYYKYYTSVEIQPGDTLWDLADHYMEHYESKDHYIDEVIKLNSLTGSGRIISGQSLILPYYSEEYKL